jgi:aldose sugar dehydrogenase
MRAAACLFVLLLVSACSGDTDPNQPEETGAGGSLNFDDIQTVASGLEVPWDIAFVDEDTILVTERSGQVRLVEDGRVREDPLLELDIISLAEDGLLGIALHPDFPEDRHAYLYYTTESDNRVSRFELDEDFRFGDGSPEP